MGQKKKYKVLALHVAKPEFGPQHPVRSPKHHLVLGAEY